LEADCRPDRCRGIRADCVFKCLPPREWRLFN
jgi:hypothetical protein